MDLKKLKKVFLSDYYEIDQSLKLDPKSHDFLRRLIRDMNKINDDLVFIQRELGDLKIIESVNNQLYTISNLDVPRIKPHGHSKKYKRHVDQNIRVDTLPLESPKIVDNLLCDELNEKKNKKYKRKPAIQPYNSESYSKHNPMFVEGKNIDDHWGCFSPTISTKKFKDCVINNYKSLKNDPFMDDLNLSQTSQNILKCLQDKNATQQLSPRFYTKLIHCATSLITMVRYVPISNKRYVDRMKHLKILGAVEDHIMNVYQGKPPRKDGRQPIRKILSDLDEVSELLAQARKNILISERLWRKYYRISIELNNTSSRPNCSKNLRSRIKKHKKLATKLSKYTSKDSTKHIIDMHNKICNKISFYYL